MKFSDSMLYRALPDCEHIDCTVQCAFESNDVFPFEQKSTNESNASEFVFFQLLANDASIVLVYLRLKSRSRDCVK